MEQTKQLSLAKLLSEMKKEAMEIARKELKKNG